MGRHVIVDTSSKTTTTTGKFGNKNLDNMGRHVIVDTSSKTTTTTGKYGNKNLDNMGRHVIVDTKTTTTTATGRYGAGKGGYGEGAASGYGYGSMSRKVETSTTKGGKSGSGYSIEKVALNKSGNEKEWGSSGSSLTFKGTSKGGASHKVTGGKKPWALEVTNGDEVFTGRHPSDEEASTGGNGYSKYSSKREVKYQPTKGGAASSVSKFSIKRTGNVITKGY